MKKRGQFYLIATLVLVGIIASMVTIYNTAKPNPEDPTVYDLSKEINYESAQVVNRGVFNAQSQSEINKNLENLTDYYAKENPLNDIFLLYGDESQISFFIYNNTDIGSVGLSFGGAASTSYIKQTQKRTGSIASNNGKIEVILSGETYNFFLKPGQNFFVIMTKSRGSEKFVSSPDDFSTIP